MRGDARGRDPGFAHRIVGNRENASFQVIILVGDPHGRDGSSGGPREDNITGLLVRAPQTEWRKSSVIAVDAGAHLASIIRILEQDMPMNSEKIPAPDYCKVLDSGPFAGVRFPHISAKANALYFFRELLHAFLITHPHLDHLSGMGINTPALEYGREAKAIVALPPAIDAIKTHIFNDSIWPNLSDEGHGGVGFVTYRRLIEGGNPRLGYGESRGYVNVCDGLATKCWSVSHGKCHRRHQSLSHARGDSFGFNGAGDAYSFPTRRMSRLSDDAHGYFAAIAQQHGQPVQHQHHASMPPGPGTPGVGPAAMALPSMDKDHMFEPVTSSAFFIRNDTTGHELLIFGDTEPDSVSMSPRNHIVWEDAASKIANGALKAIFIECSYDDSVRDADLYGHLCPRHLIAELTFLANRVVAVQTQSKIESSKILNSNSLDLQEPPTPADLKKKRKRGQNGELSATPEAQPTSTSSPVAQPTHIGNRSVSSTRRKTSLHAVPPHALPRVDAYDGQNHARPSTPQRKNPHHGHAHFGSLAEVPPMVAMKNDVQVQALLQHQQLKMNDPLKGLHVFIIHVKDTLMDGPSPGEIILGQLEKQGQEAGLGCVFDVTSCGQSIWL